ncbi:hypothetical protein HDU96_004940 [Phlyctochytrium bullatum]|nr:hypothetical protein HDU96_004940 [Phlyctochytrium bullatum]
MQSLSVEAMSVEVAHPLGPSVSVPAADEEVPVLPLTPGPDTVGDASPKADAEDAVAEIERTTPQSFEDHPVYHEFGDKGLPPVPKLAFDDSLASAKTNGNPAEKNNTQTRPEASVSVSATSLIPRPVSKKPHSDSVSSANLQSSADTNATSERDVRTTLQPGSKSWVSRRATTGPGGLSESSAPSEVSLGGSVKVPLNDIATEEGKTKSKSSFRKSFVRMLDSFHAGSSSSEPAASNNTSVERAKSMKEISGSKKKPITERAFTLIRAKSPPPTSPPPSFKSIPTNSTSPDSPQHDPLNAAAVNASTSPPRSESPLLKIPTRNSSQRSKHFKSLSAPIVKLREMSPETPEKERNPPSGGVNATNSLVLIRSDVEEDEEDFERVYAIFVARFDTLRGNMIEYQYPPDADLSGVEYQSLPSGAHAVNSDVIYFRKGSYYGICAFQRHVLTARDAEMQKERGARVRSVGIVATSFSGLHRHLPFLKSMANAFSVNLGEHDDLKTYFEARSLDMFPRVGIIESVGLPELQKDHPVGYFPKFAQVYGPNLFALWKYVLLHKRVLFYGLPPVENLSYNVFCMNLLGASTLPLFHIPTRSQFFVNVADIVELETMKSFLACTTESIFGSKPQLWDLYVHHQDTGPQLMFTTAQVKSESGEPTAPLKFTANEADNKRFIEIIRLLEGSTEGSEITGMGVLPVKEEESAQNGARGSLPEPTASDDRVASPLPPSPQLAASTAAEMAARVKFEGVSANMKTAFLLVQYFSELNTRLFSTLYEIARSDVPVLRPCRLKNRLGLHPQSDAAFIRELVKQYEIPLELDLKGKRWSAITWRGGKISCDCCPQPESGRKAK